MILGLGGFGFSLAAFVPLALAIAIVLAAVAERDLKKIPRRTMRLWGMLMIAAAIVLVLITIAQDPWLVL